MATKYKLRTVRADDAAQIADIYNPYITDSTVSFETQPLSEAEMRQRIAELSEHYPYFVAEDNDGNVVGYSLAHPWKERSAYEGTMEISVYVAADSQGKGIGRALVEALIEECRHRGYRSLIACITAENTDSCAFHAAIGFEQVSYFHAVGLKFGRKLDVVDYQLIL